MYGHSPEAVIVMDIEWLVAMKRSLSRRVTRVYIYIYTFTHTHLDMYIYTWVNIVHIVYICRYIGLTRTIWLELCLATLRLLDLLLRSPLREVAARRQGMMTAFPRAQRVECPHAKAQKLLSSLRLSVFVVSHRLYKAEPEKGCFILALRL